MKTSPLSLLVACVALLAGPGCANIEIVKEGDPNRVVNGTVEFRSEIALPDDAELVVRVIDLAGSAQMRAAATKRSAARQSRQDRAGAGCARRKTIRGFKGGSIPFSIEYVADDNLLRHGLNIDARISFAGKVRFRTANAHILTLGNAEYPHQVWVELASR